MVYEFLKQRREMQNPSRMVLLGRKKKNVVTKNTGDIDAGLYGKKKLNYVKHATSLFNQFYQYIHLNMGNKRKKTLP